MFHQLIARCRAELKMLLKGKIAMTQKKDESLIGSITTIRYGSKKPCVIEVVRSEQGEIILKTLDSSGVTTLAALLSKSQADELSLLLQSAF